jgi:HK97 family phage major capsid protein
MFADSTLKALKKLKDKQDRPLWLPGLAVKEPDTINGFRYTINEDVPAMAASAKSILFGDMSKYLIRDVMDVMIIRIAEKYIESGQVGFLCFYRTDGRLRDAGTGPIAAYVNSAT